MLVSSSNVSYQKKKCRRAEAGILDAICSDSSFRLFTAFHYQYMKATPTVSSHLIKLTSLAVIENWPAFRPRKTT